MLIWVLKTNEHYYYYKISSVCVITLQTWAISFTTFKILIKIKQSNNMNTYPSLI